MTWQASKVKRELQKLDKEAEEREQSAVYAPEKYNDNYNHPKRKWYN
jgi:hypothetical protein